MRNFKIVDLIAVLLLTVALLNCGGDSGSSTKKSSFDGTIDGQSSTYESNDTTANQFAAQISGNTIAIYLMPKQNVVIYVVGTTDDSHKLPGELQISDATYTDGANIYHKSGGSFKIDSCPELNKTFTGTMNLQFKNEVDQGTKTVSGSFSVTVTAVANPQMTCTTSNNNTNTATCGYSAEKCEGGVCCPYSECVSTCYFSSCLTKCTDPNQINECAQCTISCQAGTCASKMTPACDTAGKALDTCMKDHSCNGMYNDADIKCSRDNCCSEMKAAFVK